MSVRYWFSLTVGLCLSSAVAHADTATFNTPDFDRWNYPFNGTPGARSTAPVFGAVGVTGFDDRDGQFLIGFDTSTALPALGLGQSYQINSVTVTATHTTGAFTYDPTYDGFETYDGTTTDSDAGRPIVLTGTGFRGGFSAIEFSPAIPGQPGYAEGETFAFGDPTAEGVRNAYAAAFDAGGNLIDVSNNVSDGFDFTPFAVGTTGLTAGDAVVEAVAGVSPGSTFTFDVNLADADILGYVQQGIADGGLSFTISSLTATTQQNPGNPNFYTRDNFDPAAIDPTLVIDFTVIPEPVSLALLLIGGVVLGAARRRDVRKH